MCEQSLNKEQQPTCRVSYCSFHTISFCDYHSFCGVRRKENHKNYYEKDASVIIVRE